MAYGRILLLVAIAVGAGCSKPATGSENGPCYPNDTCNTGLVCLSSVCVQPAGGDGAGEVNDLGGDGALSGDAAGSDASRVDDAGLPCPGANILHPGTETRMVGTSIPFVGRARDPMCLAITGSNLVWTDNQEGQIGTGETFSYTFTTKGSHTVTLTAKDGASSYTAMVTFLLN